MASQFAAVFNQELQLAGIEPVDNIHSNSSSVVPVKHIEKMSPLVDKTNFSVKSLNLSHSFQHYLQKKDNIELDQNIITGWKEAGYIRATEKGISGTMSFTTKSGVQISLSAQDPFQNELHIHVEKDGTEYHYELNEIFSSYQEGEKYPLSACSKSQEIKKDKIINYHSEIEQKNNNAVESNFLDVVEFTFLNSSNAYNRRSFSSCV